MTGVDLAGMAAVVTGSSRGLGRSFAVALARAGARVVVNGTSTEAVADVCEEIRGFGGVAVAEVGSIAEDAFCRRLITRCVEEYGGIGLLVNNAGITRDRSMLKMSVEEFDEVVAVHLRGTWSCSSAVAQHMRATGGRILHITSGAGLFGMFGQANYSAAKAGIIGLTRVMDAELFRFGVRVNALAPVARTDMTSVFEKSGSEAVSHTQMFPPPESVAPVVVHLASDAASHLHGQVLSFDGTVLSVWSHPAATATWERAEGWSPAEFAEVLSAQVLQFPNPDRWGAGVIDST